MLVRRLLGLASRGHTKYTRHTSGHAPHELQLTAIPYHYHEGFLPETREQFQSSFLIYDDFISVEEEQSLFNEVEPHLKRQTYEKDHWDDAISNFRETERKHWNAHNLPVIQRLQKFAFEPHLKLLPYVHVLDLAPQGYIKPHIDSARFCGDIVAVLSLLSDSVARFVHDQSKDQIVDCLVRQRSLYVMKGSSRYDFTHEILRSEDSILKDPNDNERKIDKTRRISIVCRCEPDVTIRHKT
ncbi:alpha-ketoglutarate-dependent dioxygenase alkB homolog 7, mitochondrial-like [Tigriopus californicus]|uniref:alpha-ketoglutarate-dependent dioxygenase alkB homolog 7, mitochondrial-like n=1 Tax=Tigriopus californicus TaxID=6832 RepID=UPI0027DA8989|nr:alpha-ketoglutarate-dependent dioxygenase alkB homolog 7, mitochondrial-like [Tigriopus californicus]